MEYHVLSLFESEISEVLAQNRFILALRTAAQRNILTFIRFSAYLKMQGFLHHLYALKMNRWSFSICTKCAHVYSADPCCHFCSHIYKITVLQVVLQQIDTMGH